LITALCDGVMDEMEEFFSAFQKKKKKKKNFGWIFLNL
jgi:hypothetical protein